MANQNHNINNENITQPGKIDKEERIYKLGTRGSDLALWQAREVISRLRVKAEIEIIKTSGDRFLDIPLQGQSQTGFFTKEIESKLLSREIDIAVHSLKDLPTQGHEDLVLGAYLQRAAAADILVVHPGWVDTNAILPLKEGCKVGATSLRRQALLRLYAPQVIPTMLRGNVPSRVEKCKRGEYGAIVLAQAGVERLELDLSTLHVYRLNPEIWIPSPGQGVIAVQCRKSDAELLKSVAELNDPGSRDAVLIERQLLANFEGGCHTAFGAYAIPKNGKWNVFLGLDEVECGWVQAFLENRTMNELIPVKKHDIHHYQPVTVEEKDVLCRRIQL